MPKLIGFEGFEECEAVLICKGISFHIIAQELYGSFEKFISYISEYTFSVVSNTVSHMIQKFGKQTCQVNSLDTYHIQFYKEERLC